MLNFKIITSVCLLSLNLFALENITISKDQQQDLGVRTQSVSSIDTIAYGPYTGIVSLDKKDIIYISSNLESIVDRIHVRELEHVKKGDKLITLKSNALLNEQQNYIQALLDQGSSNANYIRNIKLNEQGIISSKKLLESKKIKRSNDLQVTSTRTQLITNGFTSSMLKKIRIDNKPIYTITKFASRDGIVNEINVNVGEYILAEHKMLEVYADGKRFIEVTVPVKHVENVNIGDKITFSTFNARVGVISNIVNAKSQSVIIKAEIQNPQKIMINRIYEAKIDKKVDGVFKVTKSALVFKKNKSFVFKQTDSGFEVIEVKIIREGPTCYVVEANLSVSDLVAASSTSALLSAMEDSDE